MKHRAGFSLVEILIVIAIATIVVFAVANMSGNVNILNSLVSQQLQSTSNVNQALQLLSTDIRSAEPSMAGAYPIDAAGTSSFAFYTDTDGDGIAERVRYFFASSSIWRGVTQPTGTPPVYQTSTSEIVTSMIQNVIIATGTPLFSYYNASYTGTQLAMTSTIDVSPIRLAGVSFLVDTRPGQAPLPEHFSVLVDIRDLRSN